MSLYAVEIPPNGDERPMMVLLVDDQALVAETVRRQLREQGNIDFHYCADPAQAIATAERIGPTVVLLDLVMPDLDGLTLCRFFRARPATRDLPIIMLSSTEDAPVKAEAFAAGASDYLVKLPDKVELIARLRYHSSAYVHKLQRDAAYRALRASQIKLEELNMQLVRLANLDGLTGLANRRYFNERCSEEWSRAARSGKPLSVIMLDVDHFKLFNDRFGHLEGDECLKRIAMTAGRAVGRPGDLIARYGGEEFIALLPETDSSGAIRLAERMRSMVEDLGIPQYADDTCVTISLGGATTIPRRRAEAGLLIKLAVRCLYRAKRHGRNCVETATLALDEIGRMACG